MACSSARVAARVMEGALWSVFWIPALFWSGAADTCLKNCFLTSTNIYYTCENISTDKGYMLRVPEIVPFECMTQCEHGWYNKNDTFLVDVQNAKSGHLPDLVAEVTPGYLITRSCLDKAYWKMDCHCSSNAILVTSYIAVETVKNVDGEKGTNREKFEPNVVDKAPSRAGATQNHISTAAIIPVCLWCWMFFISGTVII